MKKLKTIFFLILLLLSKRSFAQENSHKKYPYQAVATVGMIADVLKNIAKEKVEITTIIGQGGDPHLYKASPKDVLTLASSDIIFYSGIFLEGKMAEVLNKYSQKKTTLAAAETIDPKLLIKSSNFEGHFDPHVWMDVSLWMKTAEGIKNKLLEFDPANSDFYKKNADSYLLQLKKLDDYARKTISTINKEERILVTAHDAFQYFSRAYEIEVKAIQGISTESEAGLRDINNLVDFIVAKKIKAIFVESSVSPKNVMALIEGAKAKGHLVSLGGELFSDAMGAAGTYEGTYIGMIDHNVSTITKSLGGIGEGFKE